MRRWNNPPPTPEEDLEVNRGASQRTVGALEPLRQKAKIRPAVNPLHMMMLRNTIFQARVVDERLAVGWSSRRLFLICILSLGSKEYGKVVHAPCLLKLRASLLQTPLQKAPLLSPVCALARESARFHVIELGSPF
jgi:hypothetical protein